jgi:putative transposase
MSKRKSPYHGHRFPPEVIGHALWLYTRFCLSFRDVEDLLAERGIEVSCETIRRWCLKFGPRYRRALKRWEGRLGDTWHVDEVFIKIRGRQHYLRRAVDQDGDVLDILVQRRRDARAAERFLRKVLAGQGEGPRRLVTDKLRSYPPAARSVLTDGGVHDTSVYANNRAELSHQPTRCRERQMRRFKSEHHAQRFLSLQARVQNLFRYGRHLLRAANHRLFRRRAFDVWSQVTCA